MFRFEALLFFFIAVLVSTPSSAAVEPESPQAQHVRTFPKGGVSYRNVLLGFTSWTEKVSLTNGTSGDNAAANLFGNTFAFEYERYPVPRWGYYLQGEVLFGYANVAGTQTGLAYQLAGQSWFGTLAAARGGFRLARHIAFTLGPLAIYRKLELPAGGNVSASSGADFNYGASVDMRVRVANNWELRQEIGFLAVNANTIWSLGFGYKY